MKVTCGDANPTGNIALFYKGGCGKQLDVRESYRCTGCGGWFHHDCILKHFEEEEGHDVARNSLKRIKESVGSKNILITPERIVEICEEGLAKPTPKTKLI